MARLVLPGYTALPGSSRRYRTPEGEEISRRQYDNLRAQRAGFANRSDLERFRSSREGRMWRFKARSHDRGARGDWELLADAREVERRRAALPPRAETDRHGRPVEARRDEDDPDLVDPDGPLARLLVALGFRDGEAYWNVGETNAQQN